MEMPITRIHTILFTRVGRIKIDLLKLKSKKLNSITSKFSHKILVEIYWVFPEIMPTLNSFHHIRPLPLITHFPVIFAGSDS